MVHPQSKLDKFFMRSKDMLLLFVGCAGFLWMVTVNGVRIVGLPKEVDAMAEQQVMDRQTVYVMDRRVLVLETNMKNQTELLNYIKDKQDKTWNKVNRIAE